MKLGQEHLFLSVECKGRFWGVGSVRRDLLKLLALLRLPPGDGDGGQDGQAASLEPACSGEEGRKLHRQACLTLKARVEF